MPKTKVFFKYTEAQMDEAIADVRRGLAVATAAKKHNVPRVTLMYKAKGKTPTIRKMGRESYLAKDEEKLLVSWILTMAKVGFPIGKDQLLDSVQHLMVELKRENPFLNNRPGKKWYSSFLRRNPEVSQRTPQNLTLSRASVTSGQLKNWFSEIYDYLSEHGYTEILDDPRRIFNADETAFFLNPKGDRVLAARGEKTVYKTVNSDEKECLTVLISGNAGGDLAPPMVIFKYERIPKDLATSVPESWGIGKSDTGWMTGETFFEFITNIFYPWVVENKIKLPLILFIDGHASHLTFHVSQFCDQHKIILIALFPNATHKIQPMDVAVFRTLKAGWKDNVSQWRLEHFNNPILKKIHFCPLLKKTLAERIKGQILQNGFRKCGLFPWNPSAVEQEVEKENKLSEKINNEKKMIEISKGLLFVEKYIGKEKMAKFKNCSVWDGDITDQSLFEFYMKISSEKSDLEKEIGKKNNCEINETQQNQEEIVRTSSRTETFERLEKEDEIAENNLLKCSKNSTEIPKKHAYSCEIINNTTPVKEDGEQNNILFSPTKEASQQVVCPSENVPTPFKKALFWPGPKPSKTKKNKKEKIPSVTTSKSWQRYYENKELKKKKFEEEKKKRFEERKKKKEMKITEKENALKIKKMSRKKKRYDQSDTSSEDEWEASDSSLDDVNVFEKDTEDLNSKEIDASDLQCKEGDYVLVSFPGKKRNLKFVCVIQELLENDELEIIGMKKCTDSSSRLFVLNEKDVSTIIKSQITKLLKFPKMYVAGDRLKYEFAEDFEVDG